MTVLDWPQRELMLDRLSGKTCRLDIDNIAFNFLVFGISGPDNQKISVSIANPSFSSVEFVGIVINLGSSCLKAGSIRSDLFLGQTPSSHEFEVFDLWKESFFLLLASKGFNGVGKKTVMHDEHGAD